MNNNHKNYSIFFNYYFIELTFFNLFSNKILIKYF